MFDTLCENVLVPVSPRFNVPEVIGVTLGGDAVDV
jgi:hypothetical protein